MLNHFEMNPPLKMLKKWKCSYKFTQTIESIKQMLKTTNHMHGLPFRKLVLIIII